MLGRGDMLQVAELQERLVEVLKLQDAGEQEEVRSEGAGGCSAQDPQLLISEARQITPVHGEVLELEGIDGDEHQPGVGHHQPPEHLEQLLPQAVVDLDEDEAEQEEEHVDDLVDDEAAGEADHDEHAAHVLIHYFGLTPVTSSLRLLSSVCICMGFVSAMVTSISAVGAFGFFSSISLTNWHSRSQKVRVYSNMELRFRQG